MKRTIILVLLLIPTLMLISLTDVYAEELSEDELITQQKQQTGADDLPYALPEETREILSGLGVSGVSTDELSAISFEGVISELSQLTAESSKNPIKITAAVIAVLILTSMISGMKSSSLNSPMNTVINVVSTLCLCMIIVNPMVKTIAQCGIVIENSAKFMLTYVPIMTTVMISSGQPFSAASYKILMMTAGEAVYQTSANILVPFMNIFTGLSVVSSISSRLNLSSLCDLIYKAVKWILGFIMSIFAALLTLQGIIATAGDTAGTKAVKLAISSFVPLVGGAISDAYQTVYSCMKLLKSGIGVFAVIGVALVFVPVIIDCVLWLAAINVCASISDIFGMKNQSTLLRSCGKVIGTLLAILFSCVVVFIISTAIILMLASG